MVGLLAGVRTWASKGIRRARTESVEHNEETKESVMKERIMTLAKR